MTAAISRSAGASGGVAPTSTTTSAGGEREAGDEIATILRNVFPEDHQITDKHDLNSPHFNLDDFVADALSYCNLADLLRVTNLINSECRQLDSDARMLVFENYSKFLGAGAAVKAMSQGAESAAMSVASLDPPVERIEKASSEIFGTQAGHRGHRIEELGSTRRLLVDLRSVFQLPNQLSELALIGDHCDVVRRYVQFIPFFEEFAQQPEVICTLYTKASKVATASAEELKAALLRGDTLSTAASVCPPGAEDKTKKTEDRIEKTTEVDTGGKVTAEEIVKALLGLSVAKEKGEGELEELLDCFLKDARRKVERALLGCCTAAKKTSTTKAITPTTLPTDMSGESTADIGDGHLSLLKAVRAVGANSSGDGNRRQSQNNSSGSGNDDPAGSSEEDGQNAELTLFSRGYSGGSAERNNRLPLLADSLAETVLPIIVLSVKKSQSLFAPHLSQMPFLPNTVDAFVKACLTSVFSSVNEAIVELRPPSTAIVTGVNTLRSSLIPLHGLRPKLLSPMFHGFLISIAKAGIESTFQSSAESIAEDLRKLHSSAHNFTPSRGLIDIVRLPTKIQRRESQSEGLAETNEKTVQQTTNEDQYLSGQSSESDVEGSIIPQLEELVKATDQAILAKIGYCLTSCEPFVFELFGEKDEAAHSVLFTLLKRHIEMLLTLLTTGADLLLNDLHHRQGSSESSSTMRMPTTTPTSTKNQTHTLTGCSGGGGGGHIVVDTTGRQSVMRRASSALGSSQEESEIIRRVWRGPIEYSGISCLLMVWILNDIQGRGLLKLKSLAGELFENRTASYHSRVDLSVIDLPKLGEKIRQSSANLLEICTYRWGRELGHYLTSVILQKGQEINEERQKPDHNADPMGSFMLRIRNLNRLFGFALNDRLPLSSTALDGDYERLAVSSFEVTDLGGRERFVNDMDNNRGGAAAELETLMSKHVPIYGSIGPQQSRRLCIAGAVKTAAKSLVEWTREQTFQPDEVQILHKKIHILKAALLPLIAKATHSQQLRQIGGPQRRRGLGTPAAGADDEESRVVRYLFQEIASSAIACCLKA